MKYLKKWLSVVHPLLFAMFFVLALYSFNLAEVSPSEIVIPLVAAVGLALLILLVAFLLIGITLRLRTPAKSLQPYKIWDVKKAAIVAAIFLVLFFTYGQVLDAIGWWDHDALRIFLYVVWVGLFTCGAYFVVKTRRDLHKLSVVLNIVAVTLVIIPTFSIVSHEIKAIPQDTNVSEDMEPDMVDLVKPDTLPDIYYIILDRYASESTLEEFYDFDNSEFLDYLSNKGFYVANESISNYLKTRSSLASSLNMQYINYLTEQYGEEYQDMGPIYHLLEDYTLWRLLKSVGYQYLHLGSWWWPTGANKYADINFIYYPIPEFSMLVLKTTMAYPVYMAFGVTDDVRTNHRNLALYAFDNLSEIPDNKEPTFIFAHILLPHPPYVFDREGNHLSSEEAALRSREINYVDQVIATNDMVRELIDELLTSSEVSPIIILQSDEGPFPPDTDYGKIKWEEASEAQLREKMRILNAFYLPNVNQDVLYPSITPVNSFRIILNLYFGTDYELLPDKSYAFYGEHPYKFFDVTDKVKYD